MEMVDITDGEVIPSDKAYHRKKDVFVRQKAIKIFKEASKIVTEEFDDANEY